MTKSSHDRLAPRYHETEEELELFGWFFQDASGDLERVFEQIFEQFDEKADDNPERWIAQLLQFAAEKPTAYRAEAAALRSLVRFYEALEEGTGIELNYEEAARMRLHRDTLRTHMLRLCCIGDAVTEIPRILAATQGREMMALLLADLAAHQHAYPAGYQRRRSLEVLHRLRELRLQIVGDRREELQQQYYDLRSEQASLRREIALQVQAKLEAHESEYPEGDPRRRYLDVVRKRERVDLRRGMLFAGRLEAVDEDDDRWQQLERQSKELEGEYETLTRELATEYPQFGPRAPEIDLMILQAGLAEDAVLVLLFAAGADSHAFCLTRRGSPRLLALGGMSDAYAMVRRLILAGGRRVSMRRLLARKAPGAEPVTSDLGAMQEMPPEAVASVIAEALWKPLREAYPTAQQWHVCTHQGLHILPLTLGAPAGYEVRAYPGLLFYHQRHHQPALAVTGAAAAVALHIDPVPAAEFTTRPDPPPIPFVMAEAALFRGVWGEEAAVTRGQETLDLLTTPAPRLGLWCAAAHGQETHDGPPRVLLAFDRESKQALHLDSQSVFAAAQRPRHVYLSACVVGRLYELEGEPLGPVSAFFLHGAEFVVAPLQEIDDFYAPLLSGLFHLHYKEHRDPERALREAKAELLTGDWPQPFIDLVYKAYPPVMVEVLQRAGTRPSWLVLIWDWPLPAAARRLHPEGGGTANAFQSRYCRTASDREALARQTLDELVAVRHNPPLALRELIAWTVPFGMPR